jgi:hypothetical protein
MCSVKWREFVDLRASSTDVAQIFAVVGVLADNKRQRTVPIKTTPFCRAAA